MFNFFAATTEQIASRKRIAILAALCFLALC